MVGTEQIESCHDPYDTRKSFTKQFVTGYFSQEGPFISKSYDRPYPTPVTVNSTTTRYPSSVTPIRCLS